MNIFADISGQSLLWAFIWVVIAAVIFYLCNWFLAYLKVGDSFLIVCRVIIGLLVLIFLINALCTIAGKPFIHFP